jgi:alpha-D-ribose 1-methylphosphonate 5-phosphate C-P lyase
VEGEICQITVSQSGQLDKVVKDVLFGDVWVCSGIDFMNLQINLDEFISSNLEEL